MTRKNRLKQRLELIENFKEPGLASSLVKAELELGLIFAKQYFQHNSKGEVKQAAKAMRLAHDAAKAAKMFMAKADFIGSEKISVDDKLELLENLLRLRRLLRQAERGEARPGLTMFTP